MGPRRLRLGELPVGLSRRQFLDLCGRYRMTKNGELSRRQFLGGSGILVIGETLLSIAPASAAGDSGQPQSGSLSAVTKSQMSISKFLFGASVYPELQTRDEWNSMLDHFDRAHMTCVRVTESSWGNIEPAG